jgi:pyruvate dehydrogenase E2 component (dihydrolipoamide acetyltransferase)
MAEFRMPALGADMTSGILTEWLVRPGQQVRRGDVVAVVETDKGAIEIEIFEDAVIAELLVNPDTEVAVGAPLARLDRTAAGASPGAAIPSKQAPPVPTVGAGAPQPAGPATPAVERPAHAVEGGRRKVSPAARMHAREHGVDIDAVIATGHGGVVTVADVERALAAPAARPAPAVAPEARAGAQARSPMRHAIAAVMSRSKREIPHYYLAHTIDLEPALRWLEQRNRDRTIGERALPGALLLKAAAAAIAAAPELNGFWHQDAFVPATQVDLGVVIALRGGGLAAPTLADAANRDLDALMAALRDVTQRARGGRLRSSEVGSASLTVSSLGDTGVEALFPIIHPPQVAIVGFGGIVTRPWVVDGGLHVRRVVTATLAADHRASDGHAGARYLAALAQALQNPETL